MSDSTPDVPQKQCTKCGEWKPATPEYFGKSKTIKSGIVSRCLCCIRAQGREYQDRKRHPNDYDQWKAIQTREKLLNEQGLQTCRSCGRILAATRENFVAATKIKNGLTSTCKRCHSENQGHAFTPPDKSPEGYKRCSKCRQVKKSNSENFSPDKKSKDGFRSWCRLCCRKWESEIRLKNKYGEAWKHEIQRLEQLEAEGLAECTQCGEIKPYTDEFFRSPRRNCRACDCRYSRHYAKENYSEIKKRRRKYRKKNKEKLKVYTQKRRARKRGLPEDFSAKDWNCALEYFHGCCAVCGRQLNDLFGDHTASMDHWVPLSHPDCPGTVPENIVPLCHGRNGCNTSKHNNDPEEWLVQKFGKRKAKRILERIETYFEWLREQNN